MTRLSCREDMLPAVRLHWQQETYTLPAERQQRGRNYGRGSVHGKSHVWRRGSVAVDLQP